MYRRKPRARHEGLLVEELPGETLVYDPASHQAHCLNPAAALVWRAADGDTDVDDIAQRLQGIGLPASQALVWMALATLESAGLMAPH